MDQIAYVKRKRTFSPWRYGLDKGGAYGAMGVLCEILYMAFVFGDENKSPDTLYYVSGILIVGGGILGIVGLDKCFGQIHREAGISKRNMVGFIMNSLAIIVFMVAIVSTSVIFLVFFLL
jgi:hypothetical protein